MPAKDAFYLHNDEHSVYLTTNPKGFDSSLHTSQVKRLAFNITVTTSEYIKLCLFDVMERYYCLDVHDDEERIPYIGEFGASFTQRWSMESSAGEHRYQLLNKVHGMFLSVLENGSLFMGDSRDEAHWTEQSVYPTTSTTYSTPSPSSGDLSTPTPTDTYDDWPPTLGPTITSPSSSHALSTTAKAGIGAGCAVLAFVFAGLVLGLLHWKRKAQGDGAETRSRTFPPRDKPINHELGNFAAGTGGAMTVVFELPALIQDREEAKLPKVVQDWSLPELS